MTFFQSGCSDGQSPEIAEYAMEAARITNPVKRNRRMDDVVPSGVFVNTGATERPAAWPPNSPCRRAAAHHRSDNVPRHSLHGGTHLAERHSRDRPPHGWRPSHPLRSRTRSVPARRRRGTAPDALCSSPRCPCPVRRQRTRRPSRRTVNEPSLCMSLRCLAEHWNTHTHGTWSALDQVHEFRTGARYRETLKPG
jgi:hypothetical protein